MLANNIVIFRSLNSQCQLLGFYDWHDLWHVVSATAAFLSFGALVAADEALKPVPRNVLKTAFYTQ